MLFGKWVIANSCNWVVVNRLLYCCNWVVVNRLLYCCNWVRVNRLLYCCNWVVVNRLLYCCNWVVVNRWLYCCKWVVINRLIYWCKWVVTNVSQSWQKKNFFFSSLIFLHHLWRELEGPHVKLIKGLISGNLVRAHCLKTPQSPCLSALDSVNSSRHFSWSF